MAYDGDGRMARKDQDWPGDREENVEGRNYERWKAM